MATSDVFAGYEDDILIVKNDASEYYVPSFNVETLSEMCPGEAYAIFLSGNESLEFMYPSGMARDAAADLTEIENFKACSERSDVKKTGESQLIIFDGVTKSSKYDVEPGDILRAYADGEIVGSVNICESNLINDKDNVDYQPISLVAIQEVDLTEFDGPVLYGFKDDVKMDVRLYSL